MQIVFLCSLFVVGACVGSFVCCQARRLRIRSEGKSKKLGSRSVCLECGYKLKWYDNIPIVSWLCLRGRCRKCKGKIGVAEILAEVGAGLGFVCVGTTVWIDVAGPCEWGILLATLVLVSILIFLAVYDGMYGELPMVYLTISMVCAIIVLFLKEWSLATAGSFSVENILGVVGAVAVLGGLYLVLYLVSGGKWVGDGDWILGTVIGLALGDVWLAMVALFVANALACVVMMPMLKKKNSKKIYFGPFMVTAYIITVALANVITIGW